MVSRFVSMCVLVALAGCSEEPPAAEHRVVAKPALQTLSAEGREGLVAVDAERVVLRATEESLALDVGHILASEPTPLAPYGLLRMITGVTARDGEVTLTTRHAKLEEAFEELEISLAGDIGGASLLRLPNALNLEAILDVPYDLVLWDADEDETTVDDQIRLDARLVLSGGFGFTYKLLTWSPRFSLSTNLGLDASTTLTVPPEALNLKVGETLATYKVPVVLWAKPPVVVVVTVSVDAALDVGFAGGQTLVVGARAWFDAANGLSCSLDDGCSASGGLPDVGVEGVGPDISDWATAHAEVTLKPRLTLSLYDVAGVYAAVEARPRVDITPLQSPAWAVSFGTGCEFGVTGLGFEHGVRPSFCELRATVAASEGEPPVVQIGAHSGPGFYPFIAGAPIHLAPTAFDPETGPIAVTLSDSLGGFETRTFAPGEPPLEVVLEPGAHVLTAIATDAEGRVTEVTRVLSVYDPPPSVTINGPHPNDLVYVGLPVALGVTAVEGFSSPTGLACEATRWTSSNPADALPEDICEADALGWLPVVFNTPGPRTLTVTTDDGTNSVSRSVAIAVLPANPSAVAVSVLSPVRTNPPEDTVLTDDGELLDLRFQLFGTRAAVPWRWQVTHQGQVITVASGNVDAALGGTEVLRVLDLEALVGPTTLPRQENLLELFVDEAPRAALTLVRTTIR